MVVWLLSQCWSKCLTFQVSWALFYIKLDLSMLSPRASYISSETHASRSYLFIYHPDDYCSTWLCHSRCSINTYWMNAFLIIGICENKKIALKMSTWIHNKYSLSINFYQWITTDFSETYLELNFFTCRRHFNINLVK